MGEEEEIPNSLEEEEEIEESGTEMGEEGEDEGEISNQRLSLPRERRQPTYLK